MATLDVTALAHLLKSHRLEDARALLNNFLAAPLTEEEKGAAQLAIAMTYLEYQTEVNETYTSLLVEALRKLKEIHSVKQQAHDRIDLARVRAEIKGLSKQQ